uniref:Putative ovule protein n=1 Tax=Solanum chacoense TaxID=4108 RepID=A0A0V0GZE3_SOLCH
MHTYIYVHSQHDKLPNTRTTHLTSTIYYILFFSFSIFSFNKRKHVEINQILTYAISSRSILELNN